MYENHGKDEAMKEMFVPWMKVDFTSFNFCTHELLQFILTK